MIRRTLYFGNPVYLSKKDEQLIIKFPKADENNYTIEMDENAKYYERTNKNTVPLEDIGIIILDNQQITITQGLMESMLQKNIALITCDSKHHPVGLVLPLESNSEQNQRFKEQIEASVPLKKQLWQQTVSAKILNQALLLDKFHIKSDNMKKWARDVRSGDPENLEARASAYYWKNLFPKELKFQRDRFGEPPNNLLNYGYAILRAVVARALVSSGLLPTLGIHHHNKYNAYCLADDIMEPYRPFVDDIVSTLVRNGEDFTQLTTSVKKELLNVSIIDVFMENQNKPLMVAVHRTTSSLAKCFAGTQRKILFPIYKNNQIVN